jgi:2-keto-4-pentenoate hydratase/2-oxohepta-3-ene-1,7-dioic acid hydratase in catechol pathway
MKLLRFGEAGEEQWGMLDAEGGIRILADALASVTGGALSPEWLGQLQKLDPASLPLLKTESRIGPPIPLPRNFICIGLNYADHVAEAGAKLPEEPFFFFKSLSAFCGPYDDIKIPRGSKQTDWEVELGVIIGTKAAYIDEAEALNYVAGYTVVHDVSERAYVMKGKGFETFGPVGPYLVTKDEVADPQNLDLWTLVDGQRVQSGNTRTMTFSVPKLLSYVSQFITLHPGDIVSTGTPAGVGLYAKPEPVFLKPGQMLQLGVQGLGEQNSKTISA